MYIFLGLFELLSPLQKKKKMIALNHEKEN